MIHADVSKTLESLKKAHAEIVKRLENMVAGFAYEFVLALGNETPVGDDASIAIAGKYRNFYDTRQREFGIPMEAGYHAGSWQFSSDGNLQFTTMIVPVEGAANDAFNEAQAKYRLGQTFYIGANTPGMADLEGNSSKQTNGDSISRPAIDKLMAIHRIKLSDYYKQ